MFLVNALHSDKFVKINEILKDPRNFEKDLEGDHILQCVNYRYLNKVYMKCFLCRYMVTNLNGIDQFRVSLHIKACFESGSSCDQEIILLNNTLLPKTLCNLTLGTPVKGITFGCTIHSFV